jgi:hypothetical protein
MNKNITPITFIDRLVKKNELGQDFKLTDDQPEILRLAFTFDDNGRLPWDTIIYSCVKKSGKTTINGAVTPAWDSPGKHPMKSLSLAMILSNPSPVCSTPWRGLSSSSRATAGSESPNQNVLGHDRTTDVALEGQQQVLRATFPGIRDSVRVLLEVRMERFALKLKI